MQIKFTLKFLMIIIAIGACFFPMLGGILGLSSYESSKLQEKRYRDALLYLRKRQVAANVITEFERSDKPAAENAQKAWDAFTNARALVGLGMISGVLAITLRLWHGPGFHAKPRLASYLFSACSCLALILLASFALAAVLWIVGSAIIASIKYIILIYKNM